MTLVLAITAVLAFTAALLPASPSHARALLARGRHERDARTALPALVDALASALGSGLSLPLAFAEIISGDGQSTRRQRVDLKDTKSFGKRVLRLPVDLNNQKWVRLEVWDVAANGAFTQPVWIEN